MTIEEYLKQVEAREKLALKGPWEIIGPWPEINIGRHMECGKYCDPAENFHDFDQVANLGKTRSEDVCSDRNAQFISAARQDIPKLLSLVRKYREALMEISECRGGLITPAGDDVPSSVKESLVHHASSIAEEALEWEP